VANIKSQIKRNRQNEKRRVRNRSVRAELRTRIKNVLTAADEGGASASDTAEAMKMIDKAAAKGIIHTNTASRRKSRLQKRLNAAR
jgi:small subunit ribosomal protein S20|tara:strand:+ start:15488 stop:15745 length:258 start_codon:yes stop_codon:yes gene_type:complete